MRLEQLIKTKKAKVAVIGLGYVGLPTAVELAKTGYKVFGIDIKKQRVEAVNKGQSYIFDVSSEDLKKAVSAKKLTAFNNYQSLKNSDIVLICVPTPLDKNRIPDVSYMVSTAKEVVRYLHKGQLIILESSTYPGTTKEVILPILRTKRLKTGKDFFLAYSPERIDPGNKKYKLKNTPRVVGGITKKASNLAAQFYRSFIHGNVTVLSSTDAAEMTKCLENTFRLVNISLINELSLLCGKMEIDIWEVITAAKTKPYGFMPFYPSPKVGGHCIPLDPFYLSFKAKEYDFWLKFIELAGQINDEMPDRIVKRIIFLLNLSPEKFTKLNLKPKTIRNSKILVWGVSYKKDIGDTRESAAHDIIADLTRKGVRIDYFDPYVPTFKVEHRIIKKPVTLKSVKYSQLNLKKYDLILILTDHSGFDYEKLSRNSKLVVDTRNAIKSRKHKNVIWF